MKQRTDFTFNKNKIKCVELQNKPMSKNELKEYRRNSY